MPKAAKRKLSAILFTDMVGYTGLMARDEVLAARLREKHRAVLTQYHQQYNGEIVQYFGDGTLSVFASAVNALQCAIDIQLALKEAPKVPLRIGLHSGEVVWDKEGIYGNAVNIASRLESLAGTGTVLVSEKIREEVSNQPDFQFKDLGLFKLKNVPEAVHIYAIMHPGLPEKGLLSPSEKGVAVEEGTLAKEAQKGLPGIAVLPFGDLSPGKDQEYLCEGLADEVITDLSGLGKLKVISRHSSTQLKDTKLGVRDISKKLGARYLLTGSIRSAGERLRITAQLVDGIEDRQLWAEKFNGTLKDIFDLQEDIARRIVNALDIQLSERENQLLHARPIGDIQAYDAYLKARQEIFRMSGSSLDEAERLIDSALELIGPNALLLATKGWVHLSYIMLGIRPDPSHLKIAENCLQALNQAQENSTYGLFLRGILHYQHARIQEAVDDLKEVLRRDPGHRDAMLYLGILYLLAGHPDAAEVQLNKLIGIDPLTAVNLIMPGYAKATRGDFEGAVPYYRRAYEMEPENPFLILMMGLMPARILPAEEITPILQRLEPQASFHIFGRVARFLRLALEGKRTEALRAGADEQLQKEARWDEHAAWWMSSTYAYLDEKEPALDWLAISIEQGNFNYPFFAKHDPFLESIRGEPRFGEMMSAIKKKWEGFTV